MNTHTPRQPFADDMLMMQTSVAQLLTPVSVGAAPDRRYYTDCRQKLREGQQLGLYAYRVASARRWDIARMYCRECAPEGVVGPTLGATELLVTGTLGTVSNPATQTHRLCLAEVLTQTVSPPSKGATP